MPQSELRCFGALELKLELICDQRDEFRIGGFPLGIGHCVAEEALEGVQIATIPGDLDGVADGPLHSRRGGAKGLGNLGVKDLGDGVACLTARQRGARRGLFGRLFVEN